MDQKKEQERKTGNDIFSLWSRYKSYFLTNRQSAADAAAPPDTMDDEIEGKNLTEDPEQTKETAPEEKPADFLLDLWNAWNEQKPEEDRQERLNLNLSEDLSESDDYWVFTKELQGIAKYISITATANKEGEPPIPVNALAKIHVSKDAMQAWLFIFSPQNGGKDITEEWLQREIKISGVQFGLDKEALDKAVSERVYYQVIPIAKGKLPVDGADGVVEELIPRETAPEFKEDEHGVVDFKDLNLIHIISKGDLICRIIQPMLGENGCDVRGKTLSALHGKMPPIPKGPNTELTEDGSELRASIDGHIIFDKKKFNVQALLTVHGDVDNATGNIDFTGDVLITGDVREGFSVRAKRNITVRGMVEGAALSAEGDIIISRGMSGGGKGTLESQGRIKCRYLENCAVYAREKIYSESIICSNVFCDGIVSVLSGHGVIVGGKLTVAHEISAKRIGNQKSGMTTVLRMGNREDVIDEKNDVEDQINEITHALNDIQSVFPDGSASPPPPTDVRMARLHLEEEKERLTQRLSEIHDEIFDISTCVIKAGQLYPVTRIYIGRTSISVNETFHRCLVHYTEGRIALDTY